MTVEWAPLPVDAIAPDLLAALRTGDAVLTAPPGSGKSTHVPLHLLQAPWSGQRKVVMLEPRRLAARGCAARMAELLGEAVGETVGYRVRFEHRTGPHTRIEVVTEGLLTRRLQRDPELAGIGVVIFDEFHERSLQADLALALVLDARAVLSLDFRILVMSATLDADRVAGLLGRAAVISSAGRMFPVDVRYQPCGTMPLEAAVTQGVRAALDAGARGILGFLPGQREIRAAQKLIQPLAVQVYPLYGALSSAEQDAALRAPVGTRPKVVLATNIAQTSLTVEGITAVVDSGRRRAAHFDLGAGANVLVTEWISRASAAQRTGRAGRLEAGLAWRMWSRERNAHLPADDQPVILVADLSGFVLEVAAWGTRDFTALRLLDWPPASAVSAARELLQRLGAVDNHGRITARGRAMVELSLDPRPAAMLLEARARGMVNEAIWIAALFEARDDRDDCDIGHRLTQLRAGRHAGARHLLRSVQQLGRLLGVADADPRRLNAELAGRVLALGYPERIARRRGASHGIFMCADGSEARLDAGQTIAAARWLAIAHWQPGPVRRIRAAAVVDEDTLRRDHPEAFDVEQRLRWDEVRAGVVAERVSRFGAIELARVPWREAPASQVLGALLEGIRAAGSAALPWTASARQWQARVLSLRVWRPAEAWPDVADVTLMATLEYWLAPALAGVTRLAQLDRMDLLALLAALLSPRQTWQLGQLAPERLKVPSGSYLALRYAVDGSPPHLAVKLQELFGLQVTPVVDDGRVPVVLELLSPARRPIQTTRDLASFWRHGYAEVRRELRGRYPRHPWPEDPLSAIPTARAQRRKRG